MDQLCFVTLYTSPKDARSSTKNSCTTKVLPVTCKMGAGIMVPEMFGKAK